MIYFQSGRFLIDPLFKWTIKWTRFSSDPFLNWPITKWPFFQVTNFKVILFRSTLVYFEVIFYLKWLICNSHIFEVTYFLIPVTHFRIDQFWSDSFSKYSVSKWSSMSSDQFSSHIFSKWAFFEVIYSLLWPIFEVKNFELTLFRSDLLSQLTNFWSDRFQSDQFLWTFESDLFFKVIVKIFWSL